MNTAALESLGGSMKELGVKLMVLQDTDTIRFLTGLTGLLGMEFGRPTLLVLELAENGADQTNDGPRSKKARTAAVRLKLLTPVCEALLTRRVFAKTTQQFKGVNANLAEVEVHEWSDDKGWMSVFVNMIATASTDPLVGATVGAELYHMHHSVVEELRKHAKVIDCTGHVARVKQVKSPLQLETMAKAGKVAISYLQGCRDALKVGIPEWEAGLAALNAASRKAASLFREEKTLLPGECPIITGIPILQSGRPCSCAREDPMLCVHNRAGMKLVEFGDTIYLCCCNVTQYRGMRLGFDRTFFVGEITDETREVHDICISSQQAALDAIKPGAVCEDVHKALLAVLDKHNVGAAYRTGRSTGYASLESPEFKIGDKTEIEEGMCFIVDSGVSIPGKATVRIGDTVRVTADGYEYLTPYEKGPIIVQ